MPGPHTHRLREWCRCWDGSVQKPPVPPAEIERVPADFGDVVRKELQRDKAMQLDVLGLVNNAHPSSAELLDNAVMRDNLADHQAKNLGG